MLLLGSELLQLCLLLSKGSLETFHLPVSLSACPGSEPGMSTCTAPVLEVDLSCCRALPGIAGHVVGKSVQHKESGPRASGPRESGPRAAGPRISPISSGSRKSGSRNSGPIDSGLRNSGSGAQSPENMGP